MALGKTIKALRERKGLSQDDLSELTGWVVSQGAISALEKRDSSSSKFAAPIAAALNVSVHELLTGSAGGSVVLTNEQAEWLSALEKKPELIRLLKAAEPYSEYQVSVLVSIIPDLAKHFDPTAQRTQTGEQLNRRIAWKELGHGQIDRRANTTKIKDGGKRALLEPQSTTQTIKPAKKSRKK